MLGDDPPYLSEGTEVSAKYKGAFCEAKIRKVVRTVKCRVTYKQGLGTATVTDDQIKGTLRVGASVEARHVEKKDFVEATITKIQDCSQYTVVFDDGDITTLRRTALCLKSGRHFAESETLDQLPLTHPEHFGNPVIGGRRGRRSRQAQDDSSEDEGSPPRGSPSGSGSGGKEGVETEPEIGRVVCVELGDKKKKDNWFPGLVVAPTAQDTVRIRVRDDYLVRSFKDARYYTVPKKEATEFTKEMGAKVENGALKVAVEKALLFLEKNELPPHWDRDSLFGNTLSSGNSDSDADLDSDSSDDEPREEKDHFVAQLYKFMDDRGTPINNCPMIGNEDIDLYRLFRAVEKLGGYNRVTNQNQWKSITRRLGISMQSTPTTHNLVKQAYKKFLHSFEDFYRKLGCTMVNHPRGSTRKQRPGRSLIRDKDRNTPVPTTQQTLPKEKEKTDNDDDKKAVIEDEKVNNEVNTSNNQTTKEVVKEEEIKSVKKIKDEEIVSGQDSDANIEPENTESSSSEKSQKTPAATKSTPVVNRPKLAPKSSQKEEQQPKKKTYEKKKQESTTSSTSATTTTTTTTSSSSSSSSSSSNSSVSSTGKKEASKKDEETTKTRSKSKEDTKTNKETRETRTPSRESEKSKANPAKQRRLTDDELKKQRGRKKKEETEKVRNADKDESSGAESTTAPCYKGPVQMGDKLKVYYGPTHESKVTYEAKVIGIQEVEGTSELNYLVHYTGWNTRYDEWIKATRIAQNFTQTQGRVKRTKATPRPQTPSTTNSSKSTKANAANSNIVQGRRRAQSVAPSSSKTSSSSTSVSSLSNSNNGFNVNNKEKESSQLVRSTTPLSIASTSSRTKSPATPASNRPTRNNTRSNADISGIELRRRTRRMSGHTDLSVASESEDSDAYETDATEPERARTRSRGTEERRRRDVRRRVEDRIKPDENSEVEDDKDISEEPRRTRRLRRSVNKTQSKAEVDSGGAGADDDEGDAEDEENEDNDEDNNDDDDVPDNTSDRNNQTTNEIEQPKGRDFDLNQIRSELKGFDKAVKMEVIRMEPENSGDEEIKPKNVEPIPQPEIKDEKKDIKIEEPVDVKPIVESVTVKPDPSPSPTEDVYEFKEPEPFEFEVRNKRDSSGDKDKGKKRVFDEEQPKSPKKKQKVLATSPKDNKSDNTENVDVKRTKARRTPVKRLEENSETIVQQKINTTPPALKEFDKIVETPTLNVTTSKTVLSSVISPPPIIPINTIAHEEHPKNTMNIDIACNDSSSNDNVIGDADDIEDRLVISETEIPDTEDTTACDYQPQVFSSNEIVEKKEFLPISEEVVKIKEEKPLSSSTIVTTTTSVVSPPIVVPLMTLATVTPTTTVAATTVPSVSPITTPTIEKKILENKVSIASLATTTLTTPIILAPISARLPATSSIEEKLSAAFRQSKPRDKREDETIESRKNIKDTIKKSEAFGKRSKAIIEEQNKFKYELEKKKEKDDEPVKRDENERTRELTKTVMKKQKENNEDAVRAARIQKLYEEIRSDIRKQIEENRDKNVKASAEIRADLESKDLSEKQKRKKIISQEFIDSTDSSDSEQKLVIDNSELRDDRNESSSNFDVKLKAELDLLQEAQQSTINQAPTILPAQSLSIPQQDQLITSKSLINTKTEEEGENMNLLCEEEIPGSPAPAIDITEHEVNSDLTLVKSEPIEKKLVLLEMPFASAPALSSQSASQGSLTMTVSTSCGISAATPMPIQQTLISSSHQQQIQIHQQQEQSQQQPQQLQQQQQQLQQHQHQQQQQQLPQPQPQQLQLPQQHVPAPVIIPVQRRESNEAAPVMDNTPPDTPESTISNISGSPRGEERTGGSSPLSEDNVKINRDSSEADNDSGGKALSGYSEDDATLNTEGNVSDRTTKANKRSAEDPISPKKKKRNRKSSECGSNVGKKIPGRQSGRQTRQGGAPGSDSDDTSEGSNPVINNTTSAISGESNSNGITELNHTSRSPKPTKYNFYVELDPELDGSQRIAVLQQKLAELKKTYNLVKIELAAIERRRKKLRRREREAMKAAKAEMQQACS